MPPSAPIARKHGRPPKLHAAASLPSLELYKNRVNLAKAPSVHQQAGPAPTLPPTVSLTVPPGMPPTVMPTVINRQVSDAVEQAVAPPGRESSDARRIFPRTTK